MVTPQRPMLGAVLDALTNERDHRHYDASPSVLLRTGATRVTTSATGVDLWVHDEYGWSFRWRTTDPAEAWEILQARDLVPLGCVSRFVCSTCDGRGELLYDVVGDPCDDCDRTGHRPHPPTVAALASWASLGWAPADDGHPGIAGAEEWAQRFVSADGVRWRVAAASAVEAIGGLGMTTDMSTMVLYVPPLGT